MNNFFLLDENTLVATLSIKSHMITKNEVKVEKAKGAKQRSLLLY